MVEKERVNRVRQNERERQRERKREKKSEREKDRMGEKEFIKDQQSQTEESDRGGSDREKE